MVCIDTVNQFLQDELARSSRDYVGAVEAARWLDRAGHLRDSATRPGLPLRRMLREGRVLGQQQEPNGHWFIDRLAGSQAKSDTEVYESAPCGPPTMQDERRNVFPDIMEPGLQVVFVGTAVGDTSAERRRYYADPRNAFYRDLRAVGLTPRLLLPDEDETLPTFGIGLTDLVKDQHTSNDGTLTADLLSSGAERLRLKIQRFKPTWVCFNGKTAYTAFDGCGTTYGEAGMVAESRVYVVPSTSGRVRATQVFAGRTRTQWLAELAGRIVSRGLEHRDPVPAP